MMTRFGVRASASMLLCGSMLFVGGCNKMPWNKKGSDDSASASTSGATGSCKQYADKLCDKAGAQSQTCTNVKAMADMLPPESCKVALAHVDYSLKKIGEKRAQCDNLMNKLCKDIGEKTDSCKLVREQTPQFPPERCQMMLAHYDQVLKSLKMREAMNKPLSPEQMNKIASGDVPAFGPKDAKVTIVEFSDFQCPYCGRTAGVVEKLRKQYGTKVRFVFRQFPLPMHPFAQKAAEAALAAQAQGKFWQYHDKLFANQQKLDEDSLLQYAKQAGLNVTTFKKAVDSDAYKDRIKADQKLGQEVAVNGTPTMFLNGKRVANPMDYAALTKLIDSKLGS